jgi:hypothetical protein
MTGLLSAVASWPSLVLVLVVFGFAPGFCLRLIVLAYPRSDPRRTELIAELYAVPRIQRPLWVAEQLEVGLFEGLGHRVSAVIHRLTRRRPTIDPMAEYIVTPDRGDNGDKLPEWMHREIGDHDRRYDCDGRIFVDGTGGGLVCQTCGRQSIGATR